MDLIWLCPSVSKPVGGVKVIYRQAQLIHEMISPLGHRSSVMHPNTWRFKVNWFEHQVPLHRGFFKWRWADGKPSRSRIDGCFDRGKHIVILPELWARKYGDQLAHMGVKYAIYVQNGYYINKGNPYVLDSAYYGARCVITISEDASRCVAMAFPGIEEKILRVHYSINNLYFNSSKPKEDLITFMPRKLADHSSKVMFFLRNHLPSHWRIEAIDGLDEAGVAEILQRSKIFMSFSHFEGCPLPPLEAALSGNQVIGYTGQGAKEYWHDGIFEAVESGDLVGFSRAILRKVHALDSLNDFPVRHAVIESLARTYSQNQELSDMRNLISRLGLDD